MKKFIKYVFICGVLILSCEKSENSIPDCNVGNPLEELAWLMDVKNSLTNCTCQISLLQGKYREKTVFYVMNTDPVCDAVFQVVLWDCNGNVVKEYKPGQHELFANEVDLVESIYICSDTKK